MKIYEILAQKLKSYRDNIAIEYDGTCVTYKNLFDIVTNLSAFLVSNGVRKKDVVAIFMENSIEFVQAFFAINYIDAVVIPMHVKMGKKKIYSILNFYNIKYVITLKKYFNEYEDTIFIMNKSLCGIFYIVGNQYKFVGTKTTWADSNISDMLLVNTALILLTSGTTNISKGVMLSDNNIISNVKAISSYLKLQQKDTILLIKNLNHSSSITGELLVGINNGCTIYLTSKLPTSTVILNLIEKKSISILFAVPFILIGMLRNENFHKYNLRSVRIINFYGANMPTYVTNELSTKMDWVNLIYSYGLTEASPRVTYIFKDDLLKRQGSSGKPIEGVSVYIIDAHGNKVKYGVIGEIAVVGPNVMLGYYKNVELTTLKLQNRLLLTGDIGYLDSDGYLYVIGRKDNMIIQSGKNVYPEEIESALFEIDGVKDALVKGEEDSLLGSKIVAYIVVEKSKKLEKVQVILHCKACMEDYMVPREIHFIDYLDKNANGKTIRTREVNNG